MPPTMKVEYINPFIKAAQKVFVQMFSKTLSIGKLGLEASPLLGNQVTVMLGMIGPLEGQVFYGLSGTTALELARTMVEPMGIELNELNDIAISALGEISN